MAIQVKKTTLTAAQIIASFAAPVNILAAPPAGFVNNVVAISFNMVYGGAAYTGSASIVIRGASAGTNTVYQENTILTSVVNRNNIFFRNLTAGNSWSTQSAVFLATLALVATGNSTVDFYVVYEQKLIDP